VYYINKIMKVREDAYVMEKDKEGEK